ncbi:autophagy-related protein 16-1 isoform 2-T2 [Polymixia lowei]
MESWKNHYLNCKSDLKFANRFWMTSRLRDGGGIDVGNRLLHLQLRESEHLTEKLSQTVSDLTTVLYLKEAELQYWQSQVSHYRQEALTLARGRKALKTALADCEFTIETQSKELAALRKEQTELREGLAEAWREKEELLQRWMDEKREEAARLNKYNDTQERWHRLARRLNKHLRKEMEKHSGPMGTNSLSDATETSSSLSIQSKQQLSLVNIRA